ncbi:hypothetical protein ACH35V_17660 [Actinomadura sp. 1N219]|uniref:hypothetical protein n=1 Tax=Actinomadura sp. 1N219 TaxID=3375152 RepID=UPI00379E18B6
MSVNAAYKFADDAAPAEKDSLLGGYCDAQVTCTRMLFGIEPRPDEGERARTGFTAATVKHPDLMPGSYAIRDLVGRTSRLRAARDARPQIAQETAARAAREFRLIWPIKGL